jgi:hypothetical protein
MATIKDSQALTAKKLTTAGWVQVVPGGWLHERLSPTFHLTTERATQLQREADLSGYVKIVGNVNEAVMARLRAPFSCAFISSRAGLGRPDPLGRWRIADANDDAIASCAAQEEGYARLIVQALNEHFDGRAK